MRGLLPWNLDCQKAAAAPPSVQAKWVSRILFRKPERYGYELFGCRHYLEFPAVKLLDYEDQLESLLAELNPFALVTAAHLLTRQTRHDPEGRTPFPTRRLRSRKSVV